MRKSILLTTTSLSTAAWLLLSPAALAQQSQTPCDPAVQNCAQTVEEGAKAKKANKAKKKNRKANKSAKQKRKKANKANKAKSGSAVTTQDAGVSETESADTKQEIVEQPEVKTVKKPKVKKAAKKRKIKPVKKASETKPSADAPKPREVADKPVEQQIKNAEKEAVAVVPENITKSQKQALKKAETKRREKARDRRADLIGAAAVGVAVGALVPLLGGKVVEDQGDMFVVERDGKYFVRKDESALFRENARNVEIERLGGGRTRETVFRRDGSIVITVRDPGGYVLRREKITPDGRRFVLFDALGGRPRRPRDLDRELPPVRIGIPREEYVVSGSRYDRRSLADIFAAPVVQELPERFSLQEVRESERVRSYVRRVDIDTLTFDTNSAYVSQSQVEYIADIAGGMLDVIYDDPSAVFLVEGHTDAVGSEVYNLTLSDRRAETVARILVEAYGIPPENLVVEGYGEQFLKIDTQYDERANRRVTIRNISPLLETAQN